MKKILIQVLLVAVIVVLGFWLWNLFATPIKFEQERTTRETEVIQRLKDIRTAQRLYRSKYSHFAGNFDDLISFIKNDSLTIELAIGSTDDSVAMAQGKVKRYIYQMAVKDTLLKGNNDIDQIRYIPFSEVATSVKQEFQMDTSSVKTESSVMVPVFEAFAPYTMFLTGLDPQELINYRDLRIYTLGKDDGLKVGSLTQAINEAGNWE
ncbi:MAG: hypothetical protein RR066_03295 [Mucinivorans sp.]